MSNGGQGPTHLMKMTVDAQSEHLTSPIALQSAVPAAHTLLGHTWQAPETHALQPPRHSGCLDTRNTVAGQRTLRLLNPKLFEPATNALE
ncbi:MAG: hypothetical protein WDW38_007990 [Sanguina aurantia]